MVVGISIALEDVTDPDLSGFNINDFLPDSSALGFDLNSDLFASNEPLDDELSIPATDNRDLNWMSQLEEDESSFGLFAADDCSSDDNRLGKRDGKGSCSTNNHQFKSPQFPTFDDLMNTIVPDNSEKQDETPAELPTWINQDDRRCFSDQPFFLCCLCAPRFFLRVCQDCLPSKAFCPS